MTAFIDQANRIPGGRPTPLLSLALKRKPNGDLYSACFYIILLHTHSRSYLKSWVAWLSGLGWGEGGRGEGGKKRTVKGAMIVKGG